MVLKDRSDKIFDPLKKHYQKQRSSTSKVSYLMEQTGNWPLDVESLRAQKGELEERMVLGCEKN